MAAHRYSENPGYRHLAEFLVGATIEAAQIVEDDASARVRLSLRHPNARKTVVDIGVTGSLYDEAYLLFAPLPRPTESPR